MAQNSDIPRPETPALDRFHVFSLSNIFATESDFQGVTGALGSITLRNYSIAEKQPTHLRTQDAALEAGQNISLQSLEVHGSVRAGGDIRTEEVQIRGEVRSQSPNRALRFATRDAVVLSRYWATHNGDLFAAESMQAVSDTGNPVRTLVFRARAGRASYYNVDAAAISMTDVITLIGPESSNAGGEIIVNVRGYGEFNPRTLGLAATLKARVRVMGTVDAAKVTFHFPDARRLQILLPPTDASASARSEGWRRGFYGSIFAPRAQVRAAFGCMQGRLIAGDYSGNLQVNLPAVDCDPWE